ncbi:MAG: hypothetical protein ACYDH6_05690 [Acidimicrobiales bacterium]
MDLNPSDLDPSGRGVVLSSEFATVRVSVDRRANGPRLLVEDLEDGARVHLDPLELASFCHAGEDQRVAWLQVGPYRDAGPSRDAGASRDMAADRDEPR